MKRERFTATIFGEARRTVGAHGYVAYFPRTIPRSVELAPAVVRRLADAEAALGRLAGVGRLVPNPYLLIRPYLLREAVASTRIEGTQTTMAEVLDFDAGGTAAPNPDIEEVLNYVAALNWGLAELSSLPLGSRLMRGIHARLMDGVRGRESTPGEFRRTQNWIGAPGATLTTAAFVPPPPDDVPGLIADWERFANEADETPLLIQNALLHAQFETIHPFLDGNGRLGRLLLVFFLVARGRLDAPLLYLSAALEADRDTYYASLDRIREAGDPQPWFELYLAAVESQSIDAVDRSQRLLELRERYRGAVAGSGAPANALALVDLICEQPAVTTRRVELQLGVSRPTALRLLRRLESAGVLTEQPAGPRAQRRYVAQELMDAVAGGGT